MGTATGETGKALTQAYAEWLVNVAEYREQCAAVLTAFLAALKRVTGVPEIVALPVGTKSVEEVPRSVLDVMSPLKERGTIGYELNVGLLVSGSPKQRSRQWLALRVRLEVAQDRGLTVRVLNTATQGLTLPAQGSLWRSRMERDAPLQQLEDRLKRLRSPELVARPDQREAEIRKALVRVRALRRPSTESEAGDKAPAALAATDSSTEEQRRQFVWKEVEDWLERLLTPMSKDHQAHDVLAPPQPDSVEAYVDRVGKTRDPMLKELETRAAQVATALVGRLPPKDKAIPIAGTEDETRRAILEVMEALVGSGIVKNRPRVQDLAARISAAMTTRDREPWEIVTLRQRP